MTCDMPNAGVIRVRSAREEDLDCVVDFNARLAWETEGKQLDRDVLTRGVRQALGDPSLCRYFIAERAGCVAGQCMVTYEWSDWRDGMLWWFQSVYVHPDHRRHRVFTALYDHVSQLARQSQGVCGLRLYVEQHNSVAQQTYQRLGMRPSGHVVYEDDWHGRAPQASV